MDFDLAKNSLAPTDIELAELSAPPPEPSFEAILEFHYLERMRDKRSELEIGCPTWDTCCHCDHMQPKHRRQNGLPWCAMCQAGHDSPHPVISLDQWKARFTPKGEDPKETP